MKSYAYRLLSSSSQLNHLHTPFFQDLNMSIPVPEALREGDYAFLEKELKISQQA